MVFLKISATKLNISQNLNHTLFQDSDLRDVSLLPHDFALRFFYLWTVALCDAETWALRKIDVT